jgi:four helix bundle protein
MTIRNYTDLIAWQKAMTLVESAYRVSADMPQEERFGLISQMRRSAISVPSNIAEGQGRWTDGEYLNQLSVAHGSLRELETQLLLSTRLGLLPKKAVQPVLDEAAEVGRLVNGLAKSIKGSRG